MDMKTESMPLRASLLLNKVIENSEASLIWFHKLQGQISYRVQKFLNSNIAIINPRLERFYKDQRESLGFSGETPEVWLELEHSIEPEQAGKYMLTVSGMVSPESNGMSISIAIKSNGKEVFPNILFKNASAGSSLPFTLRQVITVSAPKLSLMVQSSGSKGVMSTLRYRALFCSIDLERID